MVAFNAFELATVTGDSALIGKANAVADVLATRWDHSLETWIDAGDSEGDSGRARSLDALLPLLVASDSSVIERVFSELRNNASFGGQCGPAGIHRAEPSFSARTYWRGPA
ncbi:MAG: hypothetical protein EBR99_05515, partial [Actinobacteria bacterium]|nr:hypothetical protein [Actinomycetota bacterium]